MNMRGALLQALSIGGLWLSGVVQAADVNHVYAGNRLGWVEDMTLANADQEVQLEGDGLMTTLLVGYKFNKAWSLEAGYTFLEEMNLGYFISGDDIDISAKYVALNYTNFVTGGRFFMRGRAALMAWEADAQDRSIFLGYDLQDEDSAVRYHDEDISPQVSLEMGMQFVRWFEWTIIGVDLMTGSDVRWQTMHTGVRFSF